MARKRFKPGLPCPLCGSTRLEGRLTPHCGSRRCRVLVCDACGGYGRSIDDFRPRYGASTP